MSINVRRLWTFDAWSDHNWGALEPLAVGACVYLKTEFVYTVEVLCVFLCLCVDAGGQSCFASTSGSKKSPDLPSFSCSRQSSCWCWQCCSGTLCLKSTAAADSEDDLEFRGQEINGMKTFDWIRGVFALLDLVCGIRTQLSSFSWHVVSKDGANESSRDWRVLMNTPAESKRSELEV